MARNAWPAAEQQLAPVGAVTIRLCRYGAAALPARARLLRSALERNARTVKALVRDFDRLPPFAPGTRSCPFDDGSAVLAHLQYREARRATILVRLEGCRAVANGDVVRTAFGYGVPRAYGPQLVALLTRLTRPRRGHVTAGAVAHAAAAERFLGVDSQGRFVTFTSDSPHVTVQASGAFGGIRGLGLDLRPDGHLLAMDAAGALYDIDPATLATTSLFGGQTFPGPFVEGVTTFTVAPDGGSALAAGPRGAIRIDLATGASAHVPALRASSADRGALVNPALDTLPDGRLAGADWARPAVATEAAPGAGVRELGGVDVDWSGPTRFSLDPGGTVGWILTQRVASLYADEPSVLVAVNPATGAVGQPMQLDDPIEAFAALGPQPGEAVPDPPTGAPLPLPRALDPSLPPDAFATKVSVKLLPQTRRQILRRRGIRTRIATSARIWVIVEAYVGKRKVCAAGMRLNAGATTDVAHCSSAEMRHLRGAPGHRLRAIFTIYDTRGDAVRTRAIALR